MAQLTNIVLHDPTTTTLAERKERMKELSHDIQEGETRNAQIAQIKEMTAALNKRRAELKTKQPLNRDLSECKSAYDILGAQTDVITMVLSGKSAELRDVLTEVIEESERIEGIVKNKQYYDSILHDMQDFATDLSTISVPKSMIDGTSMPSTELQAFQRTVEENITALAKAIQSYEGGSENVSDTGNGKAAAEMPSKDDSVAEPGTVYPPQALGNVTVVHGSDATNDT